VLRYARQYITLAGDSALKSRLEPIFWQVDSSAANFADMSVDDCAELLVKMQVLVLDST